MKMWRMVYSPTLSHRRTEGWGVSPCKAACLRPKETTDRHSDSTTTGAHNPQDLLCPVLLVTLIVQCCCMHFNYTKTPAVCLSEKLNTLRYNNLQRKHQLTSLNFVLRESNKFVAENWSIFCKHFLPWNLQTSWYKSNSDQNQIL